VRVGRGAEWQPAPITGDCRAVAERDWAAVD
jgi:hypothetical protein